MNTPFRLEKLDWQRHSLALATPLVTGKGQITRREVLVIRATIRVGDKTVVGFGEASPLFGWSDETLDACVAWLEQAPQGVDFDSILTLDERFEDLEERPSLRFGVEVALLDALARLREVSIGRLLAYERGRMPLGSVPVQFTIGAGSLEETLAAAGRAKDEGYTCLKLKVGASAPAADIARVGQVCKAYPGLTKRLDVNGAWHPDDALHVVRGLSDSRIDLIEQPVAPAFLSAFLEATEDCRVAIAPDESCVPLENARSIIDAQKVSAVVLKPQALGGILPTCDLVDEASRRGIRVIFSTLIESAIGRSAIAQLAAACPEVNGPHGLATGQWLTRDLADQPDRIDSGRLVLRSGAGLGFAPSWRTS